MLGSVRDLLHLRWRTASLMVAMIGGDGPAALAIRQAMITEGIDDLDMAAEFRLLTAQFGRRPPSALVAEALRVWDRLTQICTRCGRFSKYRDNVGTCYRCVLAEDEP